MQRPQPTFKRGDSLWVLGALILAVVLDQVTKHWIIQSHESLLMIPGFRFSLAFNTGMAGGFLADFPPVLKTVSISSIGVLVFALYCTVQWLLPIRALVLRLGLSFFMGGILGNLADRIFRGRIVDFIIPQISKIQNPALNLADVFQWIGLILIISGVIRHNLALWPKHNVRTLKTINAPYQFRYSAFVMSSVGGSILLSWVLGYSFLKSTLAEIPSAGPDLTVRILLVFCCLFAVAQALYLAVTYYVSRVISHRTAGPLFAFQRFVRKIISGEPAPGGLVLRSDDEFKELEVLASEIQAKLEK